MADNDITTAIHEAGHAVAHSRLNILQADVNIVPCSENGTLGHSVAEGRENVWSSEEAERQVLALYAGYGALLAAGYSLDVAEAGANDDFEQAERLIVFWGLPGMPTDWRARSAELMARPKNVAAVRRLADQLVRDRAIDGQLIDLYIDVADGEMTEEELAQSVALFGG